MPTKSKEFLVNDYRDDLTYRTPTEKLVMDIDEILPMIGEYDRFQIFTTVLLSAMMFSISPHSFAIVFFTLSPSWRCSESRQVNGECVSNSTIALHNDYYGARCQMNRSSWEFTTPDYFSLVTEFDLVCNKEWLVVLASSTSFCGGAVGTVLLGVLTDKYGRKPLLFVSIFCIQAGVLLSSFSPNLTFYLLCRLVIGFFMSGIISNIFILLVELVSPAKRSLGANNIWISFALGLSVLPLQAYYIQNWRTLSRVTSVPYLLFVLFWKLIPESLRWLMTNNKAKQAEEILRKIARINKKTFPDIKIKDNFKSETEVSTKDVFFKQDIRNELLIHGFIWFVHAMIYYGIGLVISFLSGLVYIDFALVSIIEIPSTICTIYVCSRFGRRLSTIVPLFLTTVTLIIISSLPEDKHSTSAISISRSVFGVLSKFFITISFNSVYLLTSETVPTVVRSRVMNILQFVLLIGAATAPWLTLGLRLVHPKLMFPVLTVFCFLATVLSFKLKETKGMKTKETFEDLHTLDLKPVTSQAFSKQESDF